MIHIRTPSPISRKRARCNKSSTLDEGSCKMNSNGNNPTALLLMELPTEIIFSCLSFLDAKNLSNSMSACRELHALGKICWKQICEREFSFTHYGSSKFDWKEYFFQRLSLQQPGILKWETCESLDISTLPSARMAHTGIACGKIIVYIGGQLTDKIRYNQIHFLDTETMRFREPTVKGNPPKFARHCAVGINEKVYIFGGYDGIGTYYSLAAFDPVTCVWSNPPTKGNTPIPRTNHAAASIGNKMYIYGGNYTPGPEESYTVLGDLWELDTETMTWTELKPSGPQPGPRTAHTLVGLNGKLYLFGGGLWEPKPVNRWIKKFNDIFVYDPESNQWSKPWCNGTIPVCSFPVSFTIHHFIFFFGGQKIDENYITNDLYYYDTVSGDCCSLTKEKGHCIGIEPKARDLGTASIVGNKVYVFAGSSGYPVNDLDILVWNGR